MPHVEALLKKRNFLVEKAKEAHIVGILVPLMLISRDVTSFCDASDFHTLSSRSDRHRRQVPSFFTTARRPMRISRRVKQLAQEAGKHVYEMVVAKPNPAKLANFPEVPSPSSITL